MPSVIMDEPEAMLQDVMAIEEIYISLKEAADGDKNN